MSFRYMEWADIMFWTVSDEMVLVAVVYKNERSYSRIKEWE